MADPTIPGALGVAALLYLCLVRSLRWRRFNAIHRKYHARFKSRTLTPEEAQEVVQAASFYDMPLLLSYSLAFALFKTYAIPSISQLLVKTRELASKERVAKRYADSEILITTWVLCPISGFQIHERGDDQVSNKSLASADADPRAMIALSRVNWLHSRYNISNEDFLYTLSLFIIEPPRWAARYGWRSLSPLESYAHFVFWSEIGRRMGIQDIPDTLEELKAWSLAYEATYMLPAQTNKEVAEYTTNELLFGCPEMFGIKNFLRNMTICVLERPVRTAMLQPAQPWYIHAALNGALHTVAFVQRWFCLPRNQPKSVVDHRVSKTPEELSPRMHPTWWMFRPWYKPESKGLGYLSDRLKVLLGLHVEMPGPQWKSAGYRLEEMGPLHLETHGHEEVMRKAAELQRCPVTGPWSLPTPQPS